ncbi:hypothetical protein F1536_23150 [Achromobacter xylosoxidans]|uniref:hypothetical protein n=1 Tax=Alcaligenes xylosoxydans xylosoxydans TaxID=85698 RepID=UPI001231B369|nr:hypothetical protein [Achromobacter xylosoxidans]KAA5921341.1 hypothetical protein F1536_23150 [Achromobacter xylosoxidans]
MTVPVAFQGEVMLAGWSQTHNGGAKVTFWLADDTDLEAFKAMTVAKGKTAGQRLALVAVEIGDDEQPVSPHAPDISPQAEKPKGEKLSWLAFNLCRNPDFLDWVGLESEEVAADHIRAVCEVGSRSDLDHDVTAAARFHEQIRKPFREWMESRK